MGMDQYLLIPFLVGWTSIYQLFWGSLGTRVLTHPHMENKTCSKAPTSSQEWFHPHNLGYTSYNYGDI